MFARGDILVERSPAPMLPLASVVIQDGYSYVFALQQDARSRGATWRRDSCKTT